MKLLMIFLVCGVVCIPKSVQISLDDIPEMLQNIEQVPEPKSRILGTFGKRQLGNEGEKDEPSESEPIGSGVKVDPEKVKEEPGKTFFRAD